MGRPIPVPCADSHCDNVRTIGMEGVTFTVECCFEKRSQALAANQLWACCADHKVAVLTAIMEDMRRPQMMKPQEAAAMIS